MLLTEEGTVKALVLQFTVTLDTQGMDPVRCIVEEEVGNTVFHVKKVKMSTSYTMVEITIANQDLE